MPISYRPAIADDLVLADELVVTASTISPSVTVLGRSHPLIRPHFNCFP